MATKEFFPGIEKIKFEGKDSKNPIDVYKRQRYTLQIEDKETTYNVNLHLNL